MKYLYVWCLAFITCALNIETKKDSDIVKAAKIIKVAKYPAVDKFVRPGQIWTTIETDPSKPVPLPPEYHNHVPELLYSKSEKHGQLIGCVPIYKRVHKNGHATFGIPDDAFIKVIKPHLNLSLYNAFFW